MKKKKDGYNLDDFGLLFSEASEKNRKAESKSLKQIFAKNGAKDLNSAESNKKPADSALDSAKENAKNPQSREADFTYAPQFQGFDEILAQKNTQDFSAQNAESNSLATQNGAESNNFGAQNSAESSLKSHANPQNEKDLLLSHPHTQNDTNALFVAYSILFLMLLVFMPQVYLANNIYTSSKNINYLKSQKDALRDENSDLQKRLESVKFNFLTLEIEEIK